MIRYVTVRMIAAHAGKHVKTVHAALKRAGVNVESLGGRAGHRIKETDANKFLLKHWPGVKPMGEPIEA